MEFDSKQEKCDKEKSAYKAFVRFNRPAGALRDGVSTRLAFGNYGDENSERIVELLRPTVGKIGNPVEPGSISARYGKWLGGKPAKGYARQGKAAAQYGFDAVYKNDGGLAKSYKKRAAWENRAEKLRKKRKVNDLNSVETETDDFVILDGCITKYKGKREHVVIPHDVTGIARSVFSGHRKFKSIDIPSSVTRIGSHAFVGCSGLTSIKIPSRVKTIWGSTFKNCRSLTSVSLPYGLKRIGSYAFSGCRSLTSISIPDSVTCIEDHAFDGCAGLTDIRIPSSLTSIGAHAFDGCPGAPGKGAPSKGTPSPVPQETADDRAQWLEDFIDSCDKFLEFQVENGVLKKYKGESDTVVIPNTVTSIGHGAFLNCHNVTSITIPNSVTSIGHTAFINCSSLTSIEIPSSVTCIPLSTFYWCSSLTSIKIPRSVTSIESEAFFGCSKLKNIQFRGTVAEWKAIRKGKSWNKYTGNYTITCTGGDKVKTIRKGLFH